MQLVPTGACGKEEIENPLYIYSSKRKLHDSKSVLDITIALAYTYLAKNLHKHFYRFTNKYQNDHLVHQYTYWHICELSVLQLTLVH